ncbi:MAG: hypothetical protein U9N61_01985 [Euryarchaeota archaeon]|nr:hypothetical protein [Euryarchaeota archaeon]
MSSYKITKASLALVVIFIAILLAIFVQSLVDEKEEYVTDQVIADIPIRADLDISFLGPGKSMSVNMVYTLIPSVDVKMDVSKGIVLPATVVFVESDLPTGQITLKKGRKYKYKTKIKALVNGDWMIYASPGVYASLRVVGGDVTSAMIYGISNVEKTIIQYRHREKVSEEQRNVLINITNDWLQRYNSTEYEKQDFNCTVLSIAGSGLSGIDIRCYGCELWGYSNSMLSDRYYFVLGEDEYTGIIKIKNVYRWAYQTPTGHQQKPVCEEVMMTVIE